MDMTAIFFKLSRALRSDAFRVTSESPGVEEWEADGWLVQREKHMAVQVTDLHLGAHHPGGVGCCRLHTDVLLGLVSESG